MQNIIVGFFEMIHGFVMSVFPSMNSGYTSNVVNAITYMANLVSGADFLIPVSDLFAVLTIVIGIKLVMFGIFAVNWVIRIF